MAPLDEVNVQPGLVRDAERQGDDLNINIYTVYIYIYILTVNRNWNSSSHDIEVLDVGLSLLNPELSF